MKAAEMATHSDTLLCYIRRLVARPVVDADTDSAILGRFVATRDERAFATLVERHGPLVLRVCRRVLGDAHEAEDAFQAAFLVLARKADSVRPREALAAWLHGVTYRVAMKARAAKARPLRATRTLDFPPADPHPDPLAEISGRELLNIIDEEVQGLHRVYRLAVILCCLEGLSLEEAARRLGWTRGSVKGRLERGRAQLHERLVRRGLTLSVALTAAELSRGAASATIATTTISSTVRAALTGAGCSAASHGTSCTAPALAEAVVKSMSLVQPKAATAILVAALVAVGLLAFQGMRTSLTTGPKRQASARSHSETIFVSRVSSATIRQDKEKDLIAQVSGQVLDPKGKPLSGADVYIGYAVSGREFQHFQGATCPRRAITETDGRFKFAFHWAELDVRAMDTAQPAIIAVATGYGPDWALIAESDKAPKLNLQLVEDLPLNGRIVDQNRKPVAGATLAVHNVFGNSQGVGWQGSFPGTSPTLKTGPDGRFHLTGLGRGRTVTLTAEGPGIQHSLLTAMTWPTDKLPPLTAAYGGDFEYVARPSRTIRGMVRDKHNGAPLAGVLIRGGQLALSTTLTKPDGSYELPCCSRSPDYVVSAQPQAGQPYFAAAVNRPDVDAVVNFDLLSGIPLEGRITDGAGQKPPKSATVEYYPLFPNAQGAKLSHVPYLAASATPVQPDGSYRLVVLPGPGVVAVVASPRNTYLPAVLNNQESTDFFHDGISHGGGNFLFTAGGASGRGSICINKYHALALINPDEPVQANESRPLRVDFEIWKR
jgi:RNA polymerase sigma factor (sigma-70 family)